MKNNIWIIFKKENLSMFRDKKSLAMMLIVPFLIPALIIGFSFLFKKDAIDVKDNIEEYNKIGINFSLTNEEKELFDAYNIEVIYDSNIENLEKLCEQNKINLYVTKTGNSYILNGTYNDNTSKTVSLFESYFESYKNKLQEEKLLLYGINPSEILDSINMEVNIKETETYLTDYISNYIVNYAFLFIIMAITVSATYPATDITAGEKERGTLETLLTFPIKSKDIIIGKYLSVTLSSIITGIISLILAVISIFISSNLFDLFKDSTVTLSVSSLLYATIVIIAYSFLISGLCIAIASNKKTFKEAQSALTPLTFISFFPGLIAFMLKLKSTSSLSLIPFVNFTLLFTDITEGNMSITNILLMILSTTIFIIIVLYIIIKQYKSEKILFSK